MDTIEVKKGYLQQVAKYLSTRPVAEAYVLFTETTKLLQSDVRQDEEIENPESDE